MLWVLLHVCMQNANRIWKVCVGRPLTEWAMPPHANKPLQKKNRIKNLHENKPMWIHTRIRSNWWRHCLHLSKTLQKLVKQHLSSCLPHICFWHHLCHLFDVWMELCACVFASVVVSILSNIRIFSVAHFPLRTPRYLFRGYFPIETSASIVVVCNIVIARSVHRIIFGSFYILCVSSTANVRLQSFCKAQKYANFKM